MYDALFVVFDKLMLEDYHAIHDLIEDALQVGVIQPKDFIEYLDENINEK